MRKLIKDTCKNIGFVFDNEIYDQIDDVSMGSPLASVLANINMTKLESVLIKKVFWYPKNKVLLSLRRW